MQHWCSYDLKVDLQIMLLIKEIEMRHRLSLSVPEQSAEDSVKLFTRQKFQRKNISTNESMAEKILEWV